VQIDGKSEYEGMKRSAGYIVTAYLKASKKEKGKILVVVCWSTGLNRDRVVWLLAARSKSRPPTKPKVKSKDGYIDLLWKGLILIEMKSVGKPW